MLKVLVSLLNNSVVFVIVLKLSNYNTSVSDSYSDGYHHTTDWPLDVVCMELYRMYHHIKQLDVSCALFLWCLIAFREMSLFAYASLSACPLQSKFRINRPHG